MKKIIEKSKPDIVNQFTGDSWVYSEIVKDHFFNPRNLLIEDPADFDAEGIIGSPACGDVMKIWLKIDKNTEKISELKWRTFGCATAIAATSMLSVMATENGGMKIEEAMKIRPQNITARLGGLPDRKIHCSVLGDKALRFAINNWFKKTGQFDRIIPEGSKVIDPYTKVTEADIEEAVLNGGMTLEDIQKRTKVGIGHPKYLEEAKKLLLFYKEKYGIFEK